MFRPPSKSKAQMTRLIVGVLPPRQKAGLSPVLAKSLLAVQKGVSQQALKRFAAMTIPQLRTARALVDLASYLAELPKYDMPSTAFGGLQHQVVDVDGMLAAGWNWTSGPCPLYPDGKVYYGQTNFTTCTAIAGSKIQNKSVLATWTQTSQSLSMGRQRLYLYKQPVQAMPDWALDDNYKVVDQTGVLTSPNNVVGNPAHPAHYFNFRRTVALRSYVPAPEPVQQLLGMAYTLDPSMQPLFSFNQPKGLPHALSTRVNRLKSRSLNRYPVPALAAAGAGLRPYQVEARQVNLDVSPSRSVAVAKATSQPHNLVVPRNEKELKGSPWSGYSALSRGRVGGIIGAATEFADAVYMLYDLLPYTYKVKLDPDKYMARGYGKRIEWTDKETGKKLSRVQGHLRWTDYLRPDGTIGNTLPAMRRPPLHLAAKQIYRHIDKIDPHSSQFGLTLQNFEDRIFAERGKLARRVARQSGATLTLGMIR